MTPFGFLDNFLFFDSYDRTDHRRGPKISSWLPPFDALSNGTSIVSVASKMSKRINTHTHRHTDTQTHTQTDKLL